MRIAAASLLLSFLIGSAAPEPAQIERIELRLSGGSSLDVEVNSQGEGRYLLTDYPRRRNGTFSLTQQQYDGLVERLAVYRREAVPMSESSMRGFMRLQCPAGANFIYDRGAVWVHWIGPNVDEHYLVDLGCDPERNAGRNADLWSILRSLPVPVDP